MTNSNGGVDPTGRCTLPGLDTTVPNPARRYNYLLGGKDNFAADRAAAAQQRQYGGNQTKSRAE